MGLGVELPVACRAAGVERPDTAPALKPADRAADLPAMSRELSCPICNADVPMTGEEVGGDEVFCAFCRAPLKVAKGSDDELELEEDF